jgi:hypothetical protein
MAKEISTKVDITIAGKGSSKSSASLATSEDLLAGGGGFQVTAGTTASQIPLGTTAPALVYVQNNDPLNNVQVDHVVGMTGWPQTIKPGLGVLLRPNDGTLWAKTTTGTVPLWVVAG